MGVKEERQEAGEASRRGLQGYLVFTSEELGGWRGWRGGLCGALWRLKGPRATSPALRGVHTASPVGETQARFSHCHARVSFNQSSAAAEVRGGILGD